MALDQERLLKVRVLLKECAAAVVGGGGSRGSGFFVADDLVLTCAHVVKGAVGEQVEVRPFGRQPRPGVIVEVRPELDVDLALVRVGAVDGEPPQPAVVLDRAIADNIDYFAVGYPSEQLTGAKGLEEIGYRGNAKTADDGSTPVLLVLQAGGALVGSGLSGGAVLSADTGAVVALVQYAQDPDRPFGGAAIPVGRAADVFGDVRRLVGEPPVATRRWRDTLGVEAWRQLGKSWGWRRQLDIVITGTPSGWEVKVDPDDGGPYTVTGRGLPEEVSEALFHWAQRRRVRRDEDVKLLGRLLTGALFPSPVLSRVLREEGVDELLLRLRFEGSKLFDVPWEFATIRVQDQDRHVAAEPGMGLVRVGPHQDPKLVDTKPTRGTATVLGITVQPEDWQAQMPQFRFTGKDVGWPPPGGLSQKLKEALQGNRRLELVPLENPIPSQVAAAAKQAGNSGAPVEVVHYMGFGQMEDGESKIALYDGEGDVEWRRVEDLFGWVEESGARLLVVEFFLPRVGIDPEPIQPRTFLHALAGRLNAVVYTRFPVHPRQSNRFNVALYSALGEGETVEVAVQRARQDVLSNQFLGDAAGFGWFTLLTGPEAGTRLVDPLGSQADAGGGSRPSTFRGDG